MKAERTDGEPKAPAEPTGGERWKWGAALGVAALVLFKIAKVALLKSGIFFVVLVTKILRKFGMREGMHAVKPAFLTAFWMVAAVGVSWRRFGTPFLIGLAAFVLARESGHAWVAHSAGVPLSPRAWVPVLGPRTLLRQSPRRLAVRAVFGAAGILGGIGVGLASLAVYAASAHPFWLALGHAALILSLLLLAPFKFLDGGRIFRASQPATGFAGAALVSVLHFAGWVRNPLGWVLALL